MTLRSEHTPTQCPLTGRKGERVKQGEREKGLTGRRGERVNREKGRMFKRETRIIFSLSPCNPRLPFSPGAVVLAAN
jgi:hypothetical protein